MALDQAQEGRRRRAPRPALHQARARDHGRRARGRRRSDGQLRRSRWRSRRRATPRCRRTTSSARSPRAPARAPTPSRSRPSLYEGYGPGGVALLIEALTDNRNRTGAEMRHLLTKNGGNLGRARLGLLPVRQAGRDRGRRQPLRRGRPDPGDRRRRAGHLARRGRVRGDHRAGRPGGRARGARERRASRSRAPTSRSARRRGFRSTRPTPRKLIRLIDALEESDDVSGGPRQLRRGQRRARADRVLTRLRYRSSPPSLASPLDANATISSAGSRSSRRRRRGLRRARGAGRRSSRPSGGATQAAVPTTPTPPPDARRRSRW